MHSVTSNAVAGYIKIKSYRYVISTTSGNDYQQNIEYPADMQKFLGITYNFSGSNTSKAITYSYLAGGSDANRKPSLLRYHSSSTQNTSIMIHVLYI